MPPSPATPEYRGIQTPRSSQSLQGPPPSSPLRRRWVTSTLAQLAVLGAITTYVFGQLFLFTPSYNDGLRVTLNEWWGVPHATALVNGGGGANAPPGQVQGHAEMVLPTFVGLFFLGPLLASVFLVDYLQSSAVRCVASSMVLRATRLLRRKPLVADRLPNWSYGEWLFVVGFLLVGNLLAFYYGHSRRLHHAQAKNAPLELSDHLELIGVTLGFNAIYNMAFLFLPATRHSVWLEFFNISYANGIKYHRWLGVVTVATSVAHGGVFYWAWIKQGTWTEKALPCWDCPLDSHKGHSVWFNVFGELALLCFLLLALFSLRFVRRQFFNLFYNTHQLFFGLALVFTVMHFGPSVWWILPSLVLHLVHRTLSSVNGLTAISVSEFTVVSPRLVKLVFHRTADYCVGQFVYLNVPAISRLQWHPFTIASSPHTSPTTATVLVKCLGDWTNQLVVYAQECSDKKVLPTIYVDGFYGASLEQNYYSEYSTLCLVGGGIGITPLVCILEDVVAKLPANLLVHKKLVVIFSFRELALLKEIAPILTKLRELDPLQRTVVFHLTITSAPSEQLLDSYTSPSPVAHVTHQYYQDKTLVRRPFAPPLRSSHGLKALAVAATLMVTWALVVYLQFGKEGAKITRHGAQLWPLQQFVEIAVVVGSSLVVVVAFVWIDRMASLSHTSGPACESKIPFFLQPLPVQTYRHLAAEFNVTIGKRPDLGAILQQTYEHQKTTVSYLDSARSDHHQAGNGLIGVFASGPEKLKLAVEVAISAIDSSLFDLHEEQFEL